MFIYKPRSGELVKGHCHASVHDRDLRSFITYQCQRKATISRMFDGELHWFCGQHDPEKVKARREASRARYDADMKRRMLPYEKAEHYERALKRIANLEHGNLDAVRLAKKALAKFK